MLLSNGPFQEKTVTISVTPKKKRQAPAGPLLRKKQKSKALIPAWNVDHVGMYVMPERFCLYGWSAMQDSGLIGNRYLKMPYRSYF